MYATILSLVALVIGQVRVEDDRWAKWPEEIVVAETVWTNLGGDADFNNNANWTGNTPGAGHTPAVFDGTTQTPPTTNLDRSGGTGFHLTVTPEYRGGLGSSGTYLKWKGIASGRAATIRGSGDYYLWPVTGENADVLIDAPGTDVVLKGQALGLIVRAGNVTATSVCDLGDVAVVHGNQSFLTIDLEDAAETPPTTLIITGGQVACARNWPNASAGTITLIAGTLNVTGLIDGLVQVFVHGGYMTYDPASSPAAELIDLFIIAGGVFDARPISESLGTTRAIYGGGGVLLGTITQGVSQFGSYDLDDPFFSP